MRRLGAQGWYDFATVIEAIHDPSQPVACSRDPQDARQAAP
jgi:hypothetical protein